MPAAKSPREHHRRTFLMTDSLQRMPRYIRKTDTGWEGADHQDGPWRPIQAPRASSALWEQQPTPTEPSYSDRLALAVCAGVCPVGGPCPAEAICSDCRRDSAAVAHELAQILRERHGGSSATADWLDGVGAWQQPAPVTMATEEP